LIVPLPIDANEVFVVLMHDEKICGHGLKVPVNGAVPALTSERAASEKTVFVKLCPPPPEL
jgi:hypothetical protein